MTKSRLSLYIAAIFVNLALAAILYKTLQENVKRQADYLTARMNALPETDPRCHGRYCEAGNLEKIVEHARTKEDEFPYTLAIFVTKGAAEGKEPKGGYNWRFYEPPRNPSVPPRNSFFIGTMTVDAERNVGYRLISAFPLDSEIRYVRRKLEKTLKDLKDNGHVCDVAYWKYGYEMTVGGWRAYAPFKETCVGAYTPFFVSSLQKNMSYGKQIFLAPLMNPADRKKAETFPYETEKERS